jgi:hypothetical protein
LAARSTADTVLPLSLISSLFLTTADDSAPSSPRPTMRSGGAFLPDARSGGAFDEIRWKGKVVGMRQRDASPSSLTRDPAAPRRDLMAREGAGDAAA